MKTILAVVVAIIIVVGGYALIKNNNNKTSTATSTSGKPASSSNASTPTTPSGPNPVSIRNYTFSPDSIIVKKGTTVTWVNKDAVAHTVTETDGQAGPKSGDLNQNKSYSFTYKTAGTFKYHCSIHTYMEGTVTVTE